MSKGAAVNDAAVFGRPTSSFRQLTPVRPYRPAGYGRHSHSALVLVLPPPLNL